MTAGGYITDRRCPEVDSLCDQHRYESGNLHPFHPGMQVIHS